MICKPVKMNLNGRDWYYQEFGPDSLNPNEETVFRLYDSNGDFVKEFGSYESMKKWVTRKVWAIHNSSNGHWLYVEAGTFDKALTAARQIEPDFNGGRLVCPFRDPDITVE